MTREQYFEKRCKAAEKYIKESPCDPDITNKQWDAWNEWRKIATDEPPPLNDLPLRRMYAIGYQTAKMGKTENVEEAIQAVTSENRQQ